MDRYCIDLVCIAGSPLDAAESNLIQQFPSLLFPFAAAEEEVVVTMDKTKAAEATGEATMEGRRHFIIGLCFIAHIFSILLHNAIDF